MINLIPEIFVRFPEGRGKVLTFSYDDGYASNSRLVEILNKYKLKGTFNFSTGNYLPEDSNYNENIKFNLMKKSDVTKLFADSDHEVIIHGYTHTSLATLPAAAIVHEILHDRENLEEQFGKVVRGMAYPGGSYDDKVVDVAKACGVLYARTIVSAEKFNLPTDWLRLPATCHHKNPRLMELADRFVNMKIVEPAQMFYLWGHASEFDKDNNWNVIEELCEFMSGREDEIWYATNTEIFEYLEDFNNLICSADLSIIKNPTSRKIWFSFGTTPMSIEPGETIYTQ